MPSRPDLREITSNVKDAFAEMDRDTLLEILTFVIKEYVVEGPPPMLVHQAETLADLQGQSFAQIISALQTRFDFPELAAFVVDGEHVGVRIGGVVQPIIGGRGPAAAAAELPRPSAGVHIVETTLAQRPPAPAAAPAQAQQAPASAPPPVRGLSLRGRPSGDAPAPAPAAPAPAAAPAAPAGQPAAPAQGQGAAPQQKPEKEGGGDDSSQRFSLLELD